MCWLVGGYVTIRDYEIYNGDKLEKLHPVSKRVVVGNRVWIWSKCDILKGTVIPEIILLDMVHYVQKSISEKNRLLPESRQE